MTPGEVMVAAYVLALNLSVMQASKAVEDDNRLPTLRNQQCRSQSAAALLI